MKLIELFNYKPKENDIILLEFVKLDTMYYGAWINANTKEIIYIDKSDHISTMKKIMDNHGFKLPKDTNFHNYMFKVYNWGYDHNYVRIHFSGDNINISGYLDDIKKLKSMLLPTCLSFLSVLIDTNKEIFRLQLPNDREKLRKLFETQIKESNTLPINIKILNGYSGLAPYLNNKSNKNIFDLKKLKYLTFGELDKEIHFTALQGDKIVGVLGIQRSPYDKQPIFWIKHISIDPDYQGKGLAERLIDSVFYYAKKHHVGLHRSSYSAIGKERLTRLFDRIKQKYPDVPFTEPTEEYIFNEEELKLPPYLKDQYESWRYSEKAAKLFDDKFDRRDDNPLVNRGLDRFTLEWILSNSNTPTAYYREVLPLDPRKIAKIEGLNNEHHYMNDLDHKERISDLAQSIRDEGFNKKHAILVHITKNGPKIVEGNHRVRAAIEAGIKVIPIEWRWLGGTEMNRKYHPIQYARLKNDSS